MILFQKLSHISKLLINLYRTVSPSELTELYKMKYKPYKKDITIHDIHFHIFLNSANGLVDNYIHKYGTWDTKLLKVIRKYISKDSVFVDVGANIGFFSLYASYLCKKVIAFEPIDFIYNQLKKSVNENGIRNIELYNYACGSKKDKLEIGLVKENIGASGLVPCNKKIYTKKMIDVTTLDIALHNRKVDFIKIDVEGFEPDVLLGARNIIQKNQPIIVFEFSPLIYEKRMNNMSVALLETLYNMNYTITDINTTKRITRKNYKHFIRMSLIKNMQTNVLCIPEKSSRI